MIVEKVLNGGALVHLLPEDLDMLVEMGEKSAPVMMVGQDETKITLADTMIEAFRFISMVARVQTGEYTAKDIDYIVQ